MRPFPHLQTCTTSTSSRKFAVLTAQIRPDSVISEPTRGNIGIIEGDNNMYIELMDTTLRDGEQTSGVSYSATEKLNIAKMLLEEVKVDRIEIASARISQGELEAATRILKWGKEN